VALEKQLKQITGQKEPSGLKAVFKRLDTLELKVDTLSRQSGLPGSIDGSDFDPKHPHKGDYALLRNQQNVNYQQAEKYAGIGPRRRQQAAAEGKLEVVGAGKSRRVTVASLLKYQPPLKNA
jgi:hypothetical protein